MGFYSKSTTGSWWLYSENDPRWHAEGQGSKIGGFQMPEEAKIALEKLKISLGEEPPKDLEYGYIKD